MTNGQMKTFFVEFIGDYETIDLVKGKVYSACLIRSKTREPLYGILEDDGSDGYAYPAKWFKKVEV